MKNYIGYVTDKFDGKKFFFKSKDFGCNVPESEFKKHLFGKTKKEYIVTERDVWQATWSPNAGFYAMKMYGCPGSLLAGNFHVWMTAKEANELIGCNLLD